MQESFLAATGLFPPLHLSTSMWLGYFTEGFRGEQTNVKERYLELNNQNMHRGISVNEIL